MTYNENKRPEPQILKVGKDSPRPLGDMPGSVDGTKLAALPKDAWQGARTLIPVGISTAYLRRLKAVPLELADGSTTVIAAAQPLSEIEYRAVSMALGRSAPVLIGGQTAILARIDEFSAVNHTHEDNEAQLFSPSIDKELTAIEGLSEVHGDAIGLWHDEAPTIQLLDELFEEATANRATDLHFEPGFGGFDIRQRVDGLLRPLRQTTMDTGNAIVSRIKILAGLNIAERRLAQDGYARAEISGKRYDLRVVTLPLTAGEAATIRILSGQDNAPTIETLGFGSERQKIFLRALRNSQGLILVTGPTGSGKTTTLAAAMGWLNEPWRKIVSAEDPVEYRLPGISQVQVQNSIGFGFADVLRSFLRVDPDVIVVGEVRDPDTAKVAVQAAMTGHLVLTTLHANSAAEAALRLAELGVERYLLAATLRLAVGQRLVRCLCQDCRRQVTIRLPFSSEVLAARGIKRDDNMEVFEAAGCPQCGGTGYHGRAALFEMFAVDEALSESISSGAGSKDLTQKIRQSGVTSLVVDGLDMVLAGKTDASEILRVVSDG